MRARTEKKKKKKAGGVGMGERREREKTYKSLFKKNLFLVSRAAKKKELHSMNRCKEKEAST